MASSVPCQKQGRTYDQTTASTRTSTYHRAEVTNVYIRMRRSSKTNFATSSNGYTISTQGNSIMNLHEAMRYLDSTSKSGGTLDSHAYNSLISLCIAERALSEGIRIRSHMAETGFQPSVFLENQFINLYAKCGEMKAAKEVFEGMQQKNYVSWNAMMSGYCLNQSFQEALVLLREMTEAGVRPDQSTYLSAIRASIGSKNPRHSEQIHSCIVKSGFFQYTKVGNALINMYAKLGLLEDAETVFNIMEEKDEISWNSIITANTQNGYNTQAMRLFIEMQQEGLVPDEFSFVSILGSSDEPKITKLHAQITKSGYGNHVFVMTALLDAYASCGNLKNSYLVFEKMPDQNLVAWNTMIAAYIESDYVKGLQLFLQMRDKGIHPDEYTITSLLKAVSARSRKEEGKQLHALAIKSGLYANTLVSNTLITMYSKYGEVQYSHQVFKNTSEPDLVSWNAMIHSYAQNQRSEEALLSFINMKLSGTEPDELTFVGVLAACTSLAWLKMGKAIHGNFIKEGLVLNAVSGSSLIDMYAGCRTILDAKRIFDNIEHKDLISWNSMIVAFAQSGQGYMALEQFCLLLHGKLEPDEFTLASLLSGFGDMMALQQGGQIHSLILRLGLAADTVVANALITMYSSLGSIKDAEKVFHRLGTAKNLVTWTAMIGGYAQNGCTEKALELFDQMESNEMKPNNITFISILTACSHSGLTKQAEMYFNSMISKYGVEPGFEHYACMVDILGRTGRLEEAEDFINRMPHEPNALVWRMLLSACRTHGDLDRGKRSAERIMALDPGDSAAYVLLSNLYATQGRWKNVYEIRELMRKNGVKKETGKSWIEVHNMVHEFSAGDHSHPQADNIYLTLKDLFLEMRGAGYVPHTDNVLQDID